MLKYIKWHLVYVDHLKKKKVIVTISMKKYGNEALHGPVEALILDFVSYQLAYNQTF